MTTNSTDCSKLSTKKIVIGLVLFLIGMLPLIFNDMFKEFVTNHLGIGMALPFIYMGMTIVFWVWADFNLCEDRK